jgi:hypothetical protein
MSTSATLAEFDFERAHSAGTARPANALVRSLNPEAATARVYNLTPSSRPVFISHNSVSSSTDADWYSLIEAVVAQLNAETMPPLADAAAEALRSVPGVDAAFLDNSSGQQCIYVLAREHGVVDREELLGIEEKLTVGRGEVAIRVRAHQGRDVNSLLAGSVRIL